MLSEKKQKVLKDDPVMFLHVERIWEILRSNIATAQCTFAELMDDLTVGAKEGEVALMFLKDLGRVNYENVGDKTVVHILDRAPIDDIRPKSLGKPGKKESLGKMSILHVGTGMPAIQAARSGITSFIFDRYSSLLKPIEGGDYASISANPSTGEMVISFLTKPITEAEFQHFSSAVDSICKQYDKVLQH